MLKLLLLGRPQIVLNDQPIVDFISEKSLALLCYLAARGETHTRNSLAGLLWGEMSETRARANLRMALYNLQQIVPGYLQVSRVEAAFNREADYWLDVEALRSENISVVQKISGSADLQSSALQYYRGDFLEGLYLEGASAFEEWLLVERERLLQIALKISKRLADQAFQQGDYLSAIQGLRRALEID